MKGVSSSAYFRGDGKALNTFRATALAILESLLSQNIISTDLRAPEMESLVPVVLLCSSWAERSSGCIKPVDVDARRSFRSQDISGLVKRLEEDGFGTGKERINS